jgi:hypothetical protein
MSWATSIISAMQTSHELEQAPDFPSRIYRPLGASEGFGVVIPQVISGEAAGAIVDLRRLRNEVSRLDLLLLATAELADIAKIRDEDEQAAQLPAALERVHRLSGQWLELLQKDRAAPPRDRP